MSHPRLCVFVLVFSLVVTLAACGQTGDLYLPEDNPKQKVKNQSRN
ncbi:MAG: lipoprotein [Gammaproteobacteria bacterium]|nr:lipoprotein [Gammaproteobacteria bacterium]